MLVFKHDKRENFECALKIEGPFKEAIPRLTFQPNGTEKKITFEGELAAEKCKINLPPLVEIGNGGQVMLEIIIDNAFFTPWTSEYKVKKSIIAKDAVVKNETIAEDDEDISFNFSEEEIVELVESKASGQKTQHLIKEDADHDDKIKTLKFLKEFKDSKIKKEIKIKVNRHKPSKESTLWAGGIFESINSFEAKYCKFKYDSEIFDDDILNEINTHFSDLTVDYNPEVKKELIEEVVEEIKVIKEEKEESKPVEKPKPKTIKKPTKKQKSEYRKLVNELMSGA